MSSCFFIFILRSIFSQITIYLYDFIYFISGLGQVQLKLGDFRSSLSNFEKVLEVYPENCEALKVSRAEVEGCYYGFTN